MTKDRSLWQVIRPALSFYKRQLVWLGILLKTPRAKLLRFRCNICNHQSAFPRDQIRRDMWSCHHCGSTVRWRSVIHTLSTELFGESLSIDNFPHRPDISGVGLSDWEGYASRLAKKLHYTNTFYHQDPLLDITDIGPTPPQYDFLISSDVFEHICQPVSRAFENARRLLKPGGLFILTVPYIEGQTTEHFPGICRFAVEQEGEDWVLNGTTPDGSTRKFHNLTFHGGPGTVVEFRLFGKQSLTEQCIEAGFQSIRIHNESVEKFGIYWNPYVAEEAPYRPLILGLDTPPWALLSNASSPAVAHHQEFV